MKTRVIGLVMFWAGAAYIFVGSWLVMWWIAPFWSSAPPEQFDGTIWALFGPVFIAISLSMPLGIVLVSVGMLLHGDAGKPGIWRRVIFALGAVLVALSLLSFPTLDYFPVVFGVSGGLIVVLFLAVLWFWAKSRMALDGSARTAADLQLASHVFFLLTASLACGLLGNPFSGLFFPEKVLDQDALPYHYSMGTKMAVCFVLGWLCTFLSQYLRSRESAMSHRGAVGAVT